MAIDLSERFDIKTAPDRWQDPPSEQLGGVYVCCSAMQEAIEEGRAYFENGRIRLHEPYILTPNYCPWCATEITGYNREIVTAIGDPLRDHAG